ncbi:MAG: hypothetical protein PWP54_394 [Thermosipho sp. (in: thermotogales)]|nr:hypothetical protein [Thermosipho sp. (in: thermotogales)]MDN5324670.1 hypothetical protein [Thermosipho sp. (in: thermotogales)]
MRTYKRKKKLPLFIYSAFIIVLSLFLFVTLISSIIRYNLNLKEVKNLEAKYNELKFEYDKKIDLYNTLKNYKESSDEK